MEAPEKTALVLNVNDNEPARYTTTVMLRRGGFEVIEAGTGERALEIIEEKLPDVVVLDVRLPDIDGFEVCRRIRADARTASIKVLCTSATFVSLERKIQGLKIGADGYLIQPFEPQELIATVHSLLRLAVAERQLRLRAERLSEADRRKDEFLAMLAHELRNPLAAIAASVPLIERRSASDAVERRARDVMKRQLAHLTHLVDDLLDVARVTQGKIDLKQEPVDIVPLLERVVSTVRERHTDVRSQDLDVDVPRAAVFVNGDATRLEQIVTNLLDNASKYTDRGGRIELSLHVEPSSTGAGTGTGAGAQQARITVKDNGIGIERPFLESIFSLFAQANVPIARTRGGLGIGLTLVRTLVDLHGGSVVAHSDGPGKGSSFSVLLPVLAAERAAADSVEGDAAGAPKQERRTILVVEDNRDAQWALRDLLETWGHDVRVASDGPSGVRVALSETFDIALIDIGLPGIDGYEVARQIRAGAKEKEPRPFLVALTGYGSSDRRDQALDAGFDLHVVKPVSADTLEALLSTRGAIADHLRGRGTAFVPRTPA